MSPYTLRPARTEDIADLRRIEVAGGEHFRALGMDLVADDDPPSAAELSRYIDSDRAWVVVTEDQPVGYLTHDPVDGQWHIEQVTVDPQHAGHGLGRQLIERVAELAAAAEVRALTLTTYRDVPWNAPYYERLGFGVLPESAVDAGTSRAPEQGGRARPGRVASSLHAAGTPNHPLRMRPPLAGPCTVG